MFSKDYSIVGKHAYYTKALSPRHETKENKLFDRYLDVYMIGAVHGFIQGRKEELDKTSEYANETANILLGALRGEYNNLMLIYRTIMLLDNKSRLTEEERIDRAFRDDLFPDRLDKLKENMEIFNSYARGGISYLYEQLMKDTLTEDERLKKIYSFVRDFHNEFYLEAHLEDIDYEKDRVY